MRVDAANARLRIIAPIIRDHGIDYERGKFQVVFASRIKFLFGNVHFIRFAN